MIKNIFSTIWGYLGVPTTTQGCQNGLFGKSRQIAPTKVNVARNDVNMQEKRLRIFFRPSGGTWKYLRPRRDAKMDFLEPLQMDSDQNKSESE